VIGGRGASLQSRSTGARWLVRLQVTVSACESDIWVPKLNY
jgi:hypothetical protein